MLATTKQAELRNPDEAIRLSMRSQAMAGGASFATLDTLGAAYAAAGHFEEAVSAAQQAVELARKAGEAAQAEEIRSRMRLYALRKPYIQPE
jgi:hypothetical protein